MAKSGDSSHFYVLLAVCSYFHVNEHFVIIIIIIIISMIHHSRCIASSTLKMLIRRSVGLSVCLSVLLIRQLDHCDSVCIPGHDIGVVIDDLRDVVASDLDV